MRERAGHDYSLDVGVNIDIPAPWLAEAMKLRLKDGKRPIFVDENGATKFFDPSIFEPGHQCALVERQAFSEMLEREGLAAIWVISGEKSVYGGRRSMHGFGGRVTHTGVFAWDGLSFSTSRHLHRDKPSAEQLQDLLGFELTTDLIAQYCDEGDAGTDLD